MLTKDVLNSIEELFISDVNSKTKYGVKQGDADNLFWCVRRGFSEDDERTVTVSFDIKTGKISYLNCCYQGDIGIEGSSIIFNNPQDLAEFMKLCKIIKSYMKVGKQMFRQTILLSMLLRCGILILATMIMLIEVVVAEKISDKTQNNTYLKTSLVGLSIAVCACLVISLVYGYMQLPFDWRFSADPYWQKILMWYGNIM